MSDDEADPELLALLAHSLGLAPQKPEPPRIEVLDDAEELGHGRLPAANSNGTLELQDVRSCCNASLALNLCRH